MSNFMNERFNSYIERIEPKKKIMKNYCDKNGLEMLWFTDKLVHGYFKYRI